MAYTGRCFCGAVQFKVKGEPKAMGYCHCESCRSWSASPVNAFCVWTPNDVEVIQGAEQVGQYAKTPMSERKFCKLCGGHLMNSHPPLGTVAFYCATLSGLDFKPAAHIYYAERALTVKDGLPEFKDLPAGFGGSGETLPE
jgi:hypothetical protein